MAVTQNTYTGNGSTTLFTFTFPYLEEDEIKVSLNGTLTTAYTLANATTISFNTAPSNGVAIRIYRSTDNTETKSTFFPGSAVRAQDLNENFLQTLYVAQETQNEAASATSTSNTALSNSAAAVSTANTANTNASAAVSTANTAASNASAAVSTANTAATNASNAVTTANTAISTANGAVTTANTASTNASAAISAANSAVTTANTASTNASAAVTTANTASTNASTAVSTANTASTNATNAVNTANTAASNASAAVTTANAADTKANAAIAAVASSVSYTPVINVAAIPASPANNTYIEIIDATGLESFTPLAGLPAGFIGDSGLTVRLRYTTAGSTWNWLNYFANDSDARFLRKAGGTLSGALALGSNKITGVGNPTASQDAATKSYVDSADSSLATLVASAQSTANTALPKSGGTLTGNIIFAATQPTATTTTAGIVQLNDTTSSTSTSTAATSNSVKSAYDLASAALPKSGGTLTGNITFAAGQPTATVSTPGIVQLNSATNSTSTTTAATASAVKDAYDFASIISLTANAAMPKAGGSFSGNVTFDNSALISGGTAAAPSIAFSADTNTGIYRPGADTFGISTGGSERVRVDSLGSVFCGFGGANGIHLATGEGAIELWKSDGAAYIDFKTNTGEDFDCRIQQASNGLAFLTGGDGATAEKLRINSNGSLISVIPGGSTLLPHFAARAWVNFNGTGTVAKRGDGNVSSITDNGVGLYTINMTTAMPDTNFAVVGMTGSTTAAGGTSNSSLQDTSAVTARTTSSVQVRSNNSSGTNADQEFISVAIFR